MILALRSEAEVGTFPDQPGLHNETLCQKIEGKKKSRRIRNCVLKLDEASILWQGRSAELSSVSVI